MNKFKVTETTVRTIVVEGLNPEDGLESARDYSSQYNWSDEKLTYTVEQVS